MGGNALKNTVTRRYRRDEYLVLEQEVIAMIRPLVAALHVPRYFEAKESFGDLDIVFVLPKGMSADEFFNTVKALLEPNDYVRAGSSFSMDYKQFQVDFICSEENIFQNYCATLDFGDFCMLLGMMLRDRRVKYTSHGLQLRAELLGRLQVPEVLLTIDTADIFAFLGLKYERFSLGYKTEEEMFEELMHCRFFNPHSFWKPHYNKEERAHYNKRPIFARFIDMCHHLLQEQEEYSSSLLPPVDTADGSLRFETWDDSAMEVNQSWKYEVLDRFGAREHYEEILSKSRNAAAVHRLFNGSLVQEITGLKGRALGDFMATFKRHIIRTSDPVEHSEVDSHSSSSRSERFTEFVLALEGDEVVMRRHLEDFLITYNSIS